ncbi:DNA-binding response regulator [Pseudolabrys taiwanensis]|uniref:DNA-binding response regulator n=1 Tax=Pseudolabrys taiwanensis TaxID=331696 RepID=A0A345ZXS0_9HYPH|nr:response regulator transcription factor [Pseudolabrys taiwanensis]AXK81717.1 DNA-binding response regulator [Pseudolabrys taiwanensis]
MFVVIDDRESVTHGYAAGFGREGVASIGFTSKDFRDWLEGAVGNDLSAINAFLLGDCPDRTTLPRSIRHRCRAPIIALNNLKLLKHTIELFEAGVDDVVHAPIHVREILVRTAVIRRRTIGASAQEPTNVIRVFLDGRDPEVAGRTMTLPRRELRILEHLVSHQGKWLTKTQLFNAIYGLFDASFDENVIESHVSKLRKKLRGHLGYDPIESKRYMGYRLDDLPTKSSAESGPSRHN